MEMSLKFISRSHLHRQSSSGESQEPEYRLSESIAGAVRMLIAAELLFHAVLGIVSSQFERWSVEAPFYRAMQCMLVLTIVLFGILAPLCGKFRVLVNAALEVGLLSLGGWYGWRHIDRLRDGVVALCGDYLLAWNEYYKTNFVVEYDSSEMSYALGFLILVLVLLFLILRYVTGVRWLMLVPPLGALSLGLLVDLLASWKGLAFFFAGTLVLYSGAGESSKIIFEPVKRERSKKALILAHFWSLLLVMAVSLVTVLAVGLWFAAPAGRIPEKAPEFVEFQNQLENTILSLGNGVHIPSNQERLDNATPTYKDDIILTISADKTPYTNLYLPEFYSGTYRNGSWRQEKRDYRDATAGSDIDGDHLGTLLRQMGYEYLNTMPYLQFSSDSQMFREYTIDYGEKRTTSAWAPYFTDLTSLQDEVWVEDEGLLKKKWSTNELSFVGWSSNVDMNEYLRHMVPYDDTGTETTAVDWYSDYVKEHYQGKSGISAVQEYAREQVEQWEWMSEDYIFGRWPSLHDSDVAVIGDWVVYGKGLRDTVSSEQNYYRSEDVMSTNLYRLSVADAVRSQLAAEADYNLYLSDIPAGTDTVQYFLETGHEGYCMHFASAGTLILQELGIPARYASGYIVKRNAFTGKRAGNQVSATVYDRNAHAWVEVYLEDFGWVPVEMTPGYETVSSELPTDANQQEELRQQHEQRAQQRETESEERTSNKELQQPNDTEEASETDTEEASETDTEAVSGVQDGAAGDGGNGPGAGISWATLAKWAGVAVLVLAVILAAVCAVRYGIRRYHRELWQELKRKQNRRAVMRINRRIYRRLQGGGIMPMGHIRLFGQNGTKAGVHWLGITDLEYERKLARAYPAITPQQWAEYMRIVKKAAFSEEAVLPQEAAFCYQVYQTHREKKEKGL